MNDHVMSLALVGLLVCAVWFVALGIVQVYKALTLPNYWTLMRRENREHWQEMVEYRPWRGRR
jgi:hypothetical protein